MKTQASEWNTYRTRFLIKARQLSGPMMFVDALGREHRGKKGDYLMESPDGLRRIAPREFFEHAYVVIEPSEATRCPPAGVLPLARPGRGRPSPGNSFSA